MFIVNEAYLANLVFKLLENKPSALALINHKGIEEFENIQFLTIQKYKYWFTSPQEYEETGYRIKYISLRFLAKINDVFFGLFRNWWKRQKVITIANKVRRG